MTPQEIRAMFARREEAWVLHDFVRLAADNAEDCLLESPTAGTVVGRRAIENVYRDYIAAFPDVSFHTEDLLIIGDRVVQTATCSGTDTGGFLGQAPSRKPFRVTIVVIFTLRGPQIVHERRVLDIGGLVLQLATETGAAMESAKLYRDTLERTRQEHELRLAVEIQRALLPPARYSCPGFELATASVSCRAIGGDFVDYFDLPNGALGIALGDVAGKGPPAALLAALIQGVLVSHVQLGGTTAETLSKVNEILFRRTIDSRFATVLYGVCAPSGSLTYCNAGHNPPILIGRSGLRRLETGGLIVGAFSHSTFEQETLQLDPGDVLVVFSDGITEAFNSEGEEFGDDRLVSCVRECQELAPPALLEQLFERVHRFSAGAVQSDDLTALVVRFVGA